MSGHARPIFYDSHMHTPLCGHASGAPSEYADAGLRAGLKGIYFTCHCPMPHGFWPSVRMEESEFDTYVAIVESAAATFKGRLDVRLGLESEYYPGFERYLRALHRRGDFHFILGSVHFQSKEYLTGSAGAASTPCAALTSLTSPRPPKPAFTTVSVIPI